MEGLIIPVVVSVYSDVPLPSSPRPASFDSAEARRRHRERSGTPNKDKVGKVTLKQVKRLRSRRCLT